MTETQNEVTCLICGQSFRALSSHLRVHNISTYEYAKRFVGASTISYESSLSQSASQTERMKDQDQRNSISVGVSKTLQGHTSYERTMEIRGKTADSLVSFYKTHKVSQETRNSIAKANTGRKTSEETKRLQSIHNVGRTRTLEACERISKGVLSAFGCDPTIIEKSAKKRLGQHQSLETRLLKSESMKELWEDNEFVEKMVKAWHKTPNNSEIQLYTVLEKYFPGEWKYVGNYQVNVKRRFPDFIRINNEKQVIEMFGIHWHDPTYFPNRLTEEELIEHYKINGYTCLVFWEYDVWCHEDEIVERVKNLT